MRRPGRFLVLCLLLVLLPLRSMLAAGQLGCEPPPPQVQHAGHDGHHDGTAGDAHDHAAKPCKLCAPCCLAAAPPPALTLPHAAAPAVRASVAPAEPWSGVVLPVADPPPRA